MLYSYIFQGNLKLWRNHDMWKWKYLIKLWGKNSTCVSCLTDSLIFSTCKPFAYLLLLESILVSEKQTRQIYFFSFWKRHKKYFSIIIMVFSIFNFNWLKRIFKILSKKWIRVTAGARQLFIDKWGILYIPVSWVQ